MTTGWFCWCGTLKATLAEMSLRDDGTCIHCFGKPKRVTLPVRDKELQGGTIIWYADNVPAEPVVRSQRGRA